MVHDQVPLVVDFLLNWNGTDEELINIIAALLSYMKQLAAMTGPQEWEKVVKCLPLFLRPKLGFYNI
jgi:hypothetical protein